MNVSDGSRESVRENVVVNKCVSPSASAGTRVAFRTRSARGFSSRRVRIEAPVLLLRLGTAEGSCTFENRCVKNTLRNVLVLVFSAGKSSVCVQ